MSTKSRYSDKDRGAGKVGLLYGGSLREVDVCVAKGQQWGVMANSLLAQRRHKGGRPKCVLGKRSNGELNDKGG